MALVNHGITTETLEKMLLSAGVIYKNLKYENGAWTGTVLGATSGGLKFNYEATWLDVAVDGATVLVKGISKQKIGEKATLEGQMTEVTEGILKTVMHLAEAEDAEDPGMKKFITKDNVGEADYLDNAAYVGRLSNGRNIIIILPNAICTEAFALETKDATQNTYAVKFECTADASGGDLNKLDLQIYYPKADASKG